MKGNSSNSNKLGRITWFHIMNCAKELEQEKTYKNGEGERWQDDNPMGHETIREEKSD